MLQMLSKVIGPIKLFGTIALAEFVNLLQMPHALVPVLLCEAARTNDGELAVALKVVATVAANVGLTWPSRVFVVCTLIRRQRGTAPAVRTDMEAVLVAFGFVFVFETVATKCAFVLFLGLVRAGW